MQTPYQHSPTGNIVYGKRPLCHMLLLALLIFFTLSGTCFASERTAASTEYMLKAVCLYNFTKFTRWPTVPDTGKPDTIVIGVVGESPFDAAIHELQSQLKKQNLSNITIVYHGPYKKDMDLGGSHLLFISSSESSNMQSIVSSLKNAPTLTVSDTNGFLEAGGMISLVLVNNRVRWKINRTAIDSSGIQVSAKLLQLAIKVEDHSGHSELLPYNLKDRGPGRLYPMLIADVTRSIREMEQTPQERNGLITLDISSS